MIRGVVLFRKLEVAGGTGKLPTLSATETHIPIPHAAGVETLVDLGSSPHRIVGEEFAVSSDAMEMFGVLDLETSFEGCQFAIGIRHANNKQFRLACTVGLRVFVCHYLAFRETIVPSWRNTRNMSAGSVMEQTARRRRETTNRHRGSPRL
jgi:hypothetical protein